MGWCRRAHTSSILLRCCLFLGHEVGRGPGTGTGHNPCTGPGAVRPSRDYVETLIRCGARRRRRTRKAGLLRRCWGELWMQRGLSSSHR